MLAMAPETGLYDPIYGLIMPHLVSNEGVSGNCCRGMCIGPNMASFGEMFCNCSKDGYTCIWFHTWPVKDFHGVVLQEPTIALGPIYGPNMSAVGKTLGKGFLELSIWAQCTAM